MKRVLRITSHTGHYRYLAGLPDNYVVGFIPRTDIPSPYASGPTHAVLNDPLRGRVILVETAHRRFDVFAIGDTPVFATDAGAEAAFMAARRAAEEARQEALRGDRLPFNGDGGPGSL